MGFKTTFGINSYNGGKRSDKNIVEPFWGSKMTIMTLRPLGISPKEKVMKNIVYQIDEIYPEYCLGIIDEIWIIIKILLPTFQNLFLKKSLKTGLTGEF